MDQDISQLQAAIDKLNAKKALLDAYARGHQGTLSPIRRLPNEILSNIFTFCSTEDPSRSKAESTRWRLCRVNARWRQLALSHHQLWASINFRFRMDGKLPYGKIAMCFERSGISPITLSLENTASDGSRLPPDLLSPILSTQPRVRALILSDFTLPSVKTLNLSNLCNLKVLDIRVTNAHSKWIEQMFEVASGLTRVVFETPDTSFRTLRIPWYQITCLILNVRFESFNLPTGIGNAALDILSRMPQLVELGLLSMPSALSRSLILPNVRTFHFSYGSGDYSILQMLTLPALTCFNIQVGGTKRSPCFRLVESMFQRSACKLESLIIVDSCISKLHLLFPSIPFLKELDIRLSDPIPDNDFSELRWTPHSAPSNQHLPHLESIRIYFSPAHQVDFNMWTEILNSRCEAVSCSPDCQTCIFPARLRYLYIVASKSRMTSPPRDLLNQTAEDHRVNLFVLPLRGHNVQGRRYFEKEIARV